MLEEKTKGQAKMGCMYVCMMMMMMMMMTRSRSRFRDDCSHGLYVVSSKPYLEVMAVALWLLLVLV